MLGPASRPSPLTGSPSRTVDIRRPSLSTELNTSSSEAMPGFGLGESIPPDTAHVRLGHFSPT